MRRVRLRSVLTISHVLLALVLVALVGNRIEAERRVAERSEALASAVQDADVLAARAARLMSRQPLLAELIEDEQQGLRTAELVTPADGPLAGAAVASAQVAANVVARVTSTGTPATTVASGGQLVAAAPVVSGSVISAVALVAEGVPVPSWPASWLGVSTWLALSILVLAAVAGWLVAGLVVRPIAELTDEVRRIALRAPIRAAKRSPTLELATLRAAIRGILDRGVRFEEATSERRDELRMLSHRLSHQLRTPLSILRLRLDDLADPQLPDGRRQLLAGVVAEQIERLDRLGGDLAELDPGRWELRREPADLVAMADAVVGRHRTLARWGGVTLESTKPAGAGVIVDCDRRLVDEAISNVVQNAVKYTPRGGAVRVTVDQVGELAVVAVADTGPGVVPAERSAVFGVGVRGSAGDLAPGAGIGLGIVADAVERHGGWIELSERPGGGTVVRLALPVSAVGSTADSHPSGRLRNTRSAPEREPGDGQPVCDDPGGWPSAPRRSS